MKCPGCNSEISDKDAVCPACGTDLNAIDTDKKDEKNQKNKNRKKIDKFRQNKKMRMMIIIAAAVLVLAAVIIVSIMLSANKGLRKSEKLAKKLGQPVSRASEFADIEFAQESDFSGFETIADSKYIYESDKKVKINGTNMPEWAVVASEDIYGNLSEVKYYDFRILEDNINGVKKKNRLDYSSVLPGTSERDADKILDMDPYIISFTNENISKIYKYYYKDKQTENIEAYNVTVSLSSSGKKVNSQPLEKENILIQYILNTDN